MKRTLLAGAAAFAVMFSSQAFAQSVAVEIDPAQQTKIEDYIVNKNIPPAPLKGSILIGSTLPADIEIRSVPAGWGPTVSKFSYAYADNRVYFVWPSTRKVANSRVQHHGGGVTEAPTSVHDWDGGARRQANASRTVAR